MKTSAGFYRLTVWSSGGPFVISDEPAVRISYSIELLNTMWVQGLHKVHTYL